MATYTFTCDVKLEGAIMIVEADSTEEAWNKACADEWKDIRYEGASVVDWKLSDKIRQLKDEGDL